MPDWSYTKADLELFADLDRVTRAMGVTPCLIGAGAIRLGADFNWSVRLERVTEDWDFVLRMESWQQYENLVEGLASEEGGFTRTGTQHRLTHRAGGWLDIVPYGPIEDPSGMIQWADGNAMDTSGLTVLDTHYEKRDLGDIRLRSATLPALVGLKLLAYRSRRPGITRDISDVQMILRGVEDSVSDDRVVAEEP